MAPPSVQLETCRQMQWECREYYIFSSLGGCVYTLSKQSATSQCFQTNQFYSHPNGYSCVEFVLFSASMSTILHSPVTVVCHLYKSSNVSHHTYLTAALPIATRPVGSKSHRLRDYSIPTQFEQMRQSGVEAHQINPTPADYTSIEAYVQTLVTLLTEVASQTTTAVSTRASKS